MTFEEAKKELDEIVAKLEKNDISIEETKKLIDRANVLYEVCAKSLGELKGKFTVLRETMGVMVEE